jgi:colanic acid biosynthesis glycosyl transferase WcaI
MTRRLRIAVLCPHFHPDTAPTAVVISRIVTELAALGHEVHVVSALPWYRQHAIEPGWEGTWRRVERTSWGSIVRVHPFPGDDKRNLLRRALGYVGFTALATLDVVRGGRVDAVIAMSPPLTLGIAGWLGARVRRGVFVFNIQDVFPDAAVTSGAISNRTVIRLAGVFERFCYRRANAVTVLSDDLRNNLARKVPDHAQKLVTIPNFVDIEAIAPGERLTRWRAEHGLGDELVVMYAGNVGFSQSLDLVLHAAHEMPDVSFVINGDGAARAALQRLAAGLNNVRFTGYQPVERLSEVLASADLHLVLLKRGLGHVSVPSKTYSIVAAGRPLLAAIDANTEVTRIIDASGAGRAVPPDDPGAFVAALRDMLAAPQILVDMGHRGRRWVAGAASPRAVGAAYADLVERLVRGDTPNRLQRR